MKAEEIKKKKMPVRKYLSKITQHLYDVINEGLLEEYAKFKYLCI